MNKKRFLMSFCMVGIIIVLFVTANFMGEPQIGILPTNVVFGYPVNLPTDTPTLPPIPTNTAMPTQQPGPIGIGNPNYHMIGNVPVFGYWNYDSNWNILTEWAGGKCGLHDGAFAAWYSGGQPQFPSTSEWYNVDIYWGLGYDYNQDTLIIHHNYQDWWTNNQILFTWNWLDYMSLDYTRYWTFHIRVVTQDFMLYGLSPRWHMQHWSDSTNLAWNEYIYFPCQTDRYLPWTVKGS